MEDTDVDNHWTVFRQDSTIDSEGFSQSDATRRDVDETKTTDALALANATASTAI